MHDKNSVDVGTEHSGGVAAESPRPALDGWMPIETAPKNGTAVLLVDADGLQVVGFYGKHNHVPIYGWLRPVELYGEEVDGFDATHWMRLPKSPSRRGHADYCGMSDDHDGVCAAVVTRLLGV